MNETKPSDAKAIFGWCMYDWANSAFVLCVVTVLLPIYFSENVVPKEGMDIPFLGLYHLSATTLWGVTLSLSAFIVFLSAPLLGAIADFTAARKRFLAFFSILGSLFTTLLFFSGKGDVASTLCLFLIAHISFVSANVFYDAFLPLIASKDEQDWVSGKGYAYGYIGGAILLLLNLALILGHAKIGLSQGLAFRLSIASAGIWWGGFSIYAFGFFHESKQKGTLPPGQSFIRIGFKRVFLMTQAVVRFKHLLLFLVAFMIYNDGIQTVIQMAGIYGKEELGFSSLTLIGCILMVQLVGIVGALLFSKLAGKIGTKRTILISLLFWSAIVIYAYVLTRPLEFWILGGVCGLVLGGSQALSRSFYSSFVPEHSSAEFFGFFSVFSKLSTILGPFVFASVRHITESARNSILMLIFFFIVGFVLLALVDEEKARKVKEAHHDALDNPISVL